ncbi:homocysteine S-methyltransferase family protein [Gudongella oleilytica]|uniref:homocysteine S-methyltransferase family protein n=1 Tax=Gudongella oleilytica TaxID=1582259 RepID=UPI002A35A9C6|nr:homocysteine S-methyltransferase family protein [Gudongella oleilytica]MDY0257633.1 homocysteine S-methyltransferase family protein [Gudongella oleilytica]
MDIRKKLRDGLLIFDGAMGTMLQNSGLKLGELPEILNITSPETIVGIHSKYIDAGADVIITNTFGANEIKMSSSSYSVENIIESAVRNAKKAAMGKDVGIALDIGPIGELMEPMGTLSFETAYEIFKRQVIQGVKSGVDVILIETMTDLYEVKAAVLAAKENSNLPVFCTMSYEENGRTFTGCNIVSMVMVLQGLGVDALGVNCSLGPKELEPLIYEILNISKLPVMVQPNAGIPTIVNGRTTYNISPSDFAEYSSRFAERGVRILGGCCGTTDKHIEALVKAVDNRKPANWQHINLSGVCTPTRTVVIDGVKIIGERINPTGKKRFQEALRKQDIDFVLREAIGQVDAGADILDVNVGLPDIDEVKIMTKVIKEVQSIMDVPLQIDSTDPKVIESGLRIYNGKAIVNSVNGEDRILESILPIVKKYGAAVVGLTLDERGIPETAIERFSIAEKIVRRAIEFGIAREDIYIDCLTLTAAAQQKEVRETLKTISLVKERLDVKTVLGVSNVSFGLPNRELINNTFLAAAIYAGLDLPIINPMNEAMMETIRASRVLWNEDKGGVDYIKSFENNKTELIVPDKKTESEDLFKIINNGIKEEAKAATIKLLSQKEPLQIVNEYIIPALDLVGERYEKGYIFLPQLIRAAETVNSSFEIIKERLSAEACADISKGKIILATVKGDIHDIGKNIVKVLLENYNYEVLDLGRDIPKEIIIEEALKNDVKLIGLSALMTTTVKSMEDIIFALKETNKDFRVMVGGAVLNEEYAKMIKADYYAKDAKDAVSIARIVLG